MDIETLALHGCYKPDAQTGATVVPVHQTAAYAYESAEEIAAVFGGQAPGYVYSRLGNPTTAAFEQRLALLEGGIGCLSCASGMAAIATAIMGLTRAGDHILAAKGLFGGTVSLLSKTLSRFGIETTYVNFGDLTAVEAALRPETKLVFIETITNPQMDVPDLPAIAEIAHRANVPLVVDNTLATPLLCRPGEWGADVVIHSVTKFINGHGNSIGCAIIDTGNYNWRAGIFEDVKFLAQRAGKLAFLAHLRTQIYRDLGCCPSPFNSFLHLTGLEGLPLRMEAHCRNALALAEYLANQAQVCWVHYPGLASSPHHAIATKLFQGRYGAVLTFSLGSRDAATRFINTIRLAQNMTNIGDSKTLIIHPASTIFQEFSPEERLAMGVTDDLIRVSVGVEHIKDIIADFESAFQTIEKD